MKFLALVFTMIAFSGCGTLKTLTSPGIVKVLPHYLDASGNHSDGPTLLHRDVYQRKLRTNPGLVHGVRYDVNWYARGEVTLRLELRGSNPEPMKVEQKINQDLGRTRWTSILIDGKTYRSLEQPEAWRISIWRGEEMLDEQVSFLW